MRLALVCGAACTWATPRQRQQSFVTGITPEEISATAPAQPDAGEARVVKVLVLADDDFRSLDPAIDDAWLRLAAALKTLGKTEELERVRAKFQLQFGKPLR